MASDSLYTLPKPRTLYRGLDSVVNGWIGRSRRRSSVVQELLTDAAQIDAHASQITELTDEELDQRLIEKRTLFRRRAKPGDAAPANLPRGCRACSRASVFPHGRRVLVHLEASGRTGSSGKHL